MSRRARTRLFLGAAAVLGAVLLWGLLALPRPVAPPPPSARLSTSVAVHERHVTDTVAGVTFDLRGLDTLGEELILFVAATGAAVLLRAQRDEHDEADDDSEEDPGAPGVLRVAATTLVGPVLVLGAYIVAHGHLTPGGGFQGGVIFAAALVLVYAAGKTLATDPVHPVASIEIVEAVGAAAYVLVALAGLVVAGVALANFLALGTAGQLLSGGTILVLQVAVGAEVAGAVTLVLTEFLDQLVLE
jgi:multicomponent Na+:H+ antiporter subunit B